MTTAEQAGQVKAFSDFGVDPDIVDALTAASITSPFPIQELTLPLALSGADLIGQARTGTGKTLAFGIPLLQRCDPERLETQALVIVPTRELCLQVADDLEQAGARKGVRIVAAYGGKAIDPQSEAIAKGASIVVGTPGRLLDLFRRGVLQLGTVTNLVLDEADEMLDLGFLPDVEQLIQATANDRQTLLFSATMPSAVVALARRYMSKPTFLRADVEEVRIAPATRQFFFSCHRMDKPAVLARILQAPDRGLCLAFTRTKRMADVLADELNTRGIAAAPIHSDLRQEARERALDRFRKGKVDVLVATEVAARGLDIDDVTHVVNYDCPDDEKMYLHRIGRTGRAGAAGVAVTLAVWNEAARLEMIKKALDIAEPTHEVFSTSPMLDELFDLPERGSRPNRVVRPPEGGDKRERSRRGSRAKTTPTDKPSSKRDSRANRSTQGSGTGRSTPEKATSTPEPTDDGESRTRIRRRRRTGSRPAQEASPDAEGSSMAAKKGTEADQQPSKRTERAPRSRTRTRAVGDEPTGSRRPDRPRQDRREGQRQRPSRQAGDGRGSRPKQQGSASNGRGRERLDLDEVRGNGKPGLNRPMRIAHLP